MLRRAFPRGRAQIHLVRDAEAMEVVLRNMLVDAIVVDLQPATATTTGWRAIEWATRHAPIPAVALVAPRTLDATLLARLHGAGLFSGLDHGQRDAVLDGAAGV